MDRTSAFLQEFKNEDFKPVQISNQTILGPQNAEYSKISNQISKDMIILNNLLTKCENDYTSDDRTIDAQLKQLFSQIQNNIQVLISIRGNNNAINNIQGQARAQQYFMTQLAQRYQQYHSHRDSENFEMSRHLSENQSKLKISSDIEEGGASAVELVMSQDRNQAAQNIQRETLNIVSLFAQLQQLIAGQDDMIRRIDQYTQEALDNTEEGTKQLESYYQKIKGNRRLMIKIFIVLMIFVLTFIVII